MFIWIGLEHEADRDLEAEAETDTVDVVRVTADPGMIYNRQLAGFTHIF